MKLVLVTTAILSAVLLLGGCLGTPADHLQQPQAVKGVLDLRGWNFAQHGLINLDGEWEFYWESLLAPAAFQQQAPPEMTGFIDIPGTWGDYQVENQELANDGYATFRLKILVDKTAQTFALRVKQIETSHQLYVDHQRVGANGVVGTAAETSTPQYLPYIATFNPTGDSIEIVLQASNYVHYKGGIHRQIEFGPLSQIRQSREHALALELFLLGSILMMALYHWGLFALRREDPSPLYFGLFCFAIVARMLVTEEHFITQIFPNFSWELSTQIRLLTVPVSTIFFSMFAQRLFPAEYWKVMLRVIQFVCLANVIIVLATPADVALNTSRPSQLFVFIACLYNVSVFVRASLNKRQGALIVLMGYVLLVLTVVNDILISNNVIHSVNLIPLGLFILIFSQAFLLSSRFAKIFIQTEHLSVELAQKNQRLEQVDKLKDAFLANTSHELRTPLNGIIGLTESLMAGATGRLSSATLANMELIVASGKRLCNLVNDILDFSKMQNNELTLQIKPLDLHTLVEVVLRLSEPLMGNKQIELCNTIPKTIPFVLADENRLQQMMHNLIGNAIKFTENGRVTISAEVMTSSSPKGGDFLAVRVEDTGIGIQADKLDDIFQSFEQGDGSTAREYGGTGLGLSITKQLVELHGGEIWVESIVGQGSTFTLTLPITSQSAELPAAPTLEKAAVATPGLNLDDDLDAALMEIASEAAVQTNGQYNVLIVDDEPINLQVLSNHLSQQNYQVTKATSGMQALDILQEAHFDMIILDIMMPKMSGYEVCQRLRDTYPPHELPVVMLTAKDQIADLVQGFDSGANDYLSKPFSKDELLRRIRTHLQITKTNKSYGRFVPQEFLGFLEKESIIDVQLGDNTQREMTILFSDIRGFTSLSENMTPSENFAFVNAYLTQMEPCIIEHQGFIDKYIGDAIMALFPTHADDAVQGAISMLHRLTAYNQDHLTDPDLEIGIGLHTGMLMLGTVGGHNRMDSTVISDAVNLAARMESLTKHYGAMLLITEETYQQLEDPSRYTIRWIDRVAVKGKSEPVTIYEVLDGLPETRRQITIQTLTQFEAGVTAYHQQSFDEAKAYFEQVIDMNPNDKAASLYLDRINAYVIEGCPVDWDGVSRMTHK